MESIDMTICESNEPAIVIENENDVQTYKLTIKTSETKWCPRCSQHKSKSNFYACNDPRSLLKLATYCKLCTLERNRESRNDPARREAILARAREQNARRRGANQEAILEKKQIKAELRAIKEQQRRADAEKKQADREATAGAPGRTVAKRKMPVIDAVQAVGEWSMTMEWIEVKKRQQNEQCQLCHDDLKYWSTDWIVKKQDGGLLEADNIQLLCIDCARARRPLTNKEYR